MCFLQIVQMLLLNILLEGQFLNYGLSVAEFASETKPFERVDPMSRLFPKVSKCTIYTYGSSGSVQTHDALCVLPLNVVNEKTFVFLWFWLIFLAIAGTFAITYRIIVFTQVHARIYLLRASTRTVPIAQIQAIVKTINFGDWFLLYQLSRNVNPIVYRELITELANKFSGKCCSHLA